MELFLKGGGYHLKSKLHSSVRNGGDREQQSHAVALYAAMLSSCMLWLYHLMFSPKT